MSKATTVATLYNEYWAHTSGRVTPMFYQIQGKRKTEAEMPIPWRETIPLINFQCKIQKGILPRGKLWFHMLDLSVKK